MPDPEQYGANRLMMRSQTSIGSPQCGQRGSGPGVAFDRFTNRKQFPQTISSPLPGLESE